MSGKPPTIFGVLGGVLLLGGAWAFPAQARDEVTESDFLDELPVVLSASRLSQPLARAPAAVTIIDQEMIRASGFRDIPDLFRLVPGFNVAYTRGNTWGVGYHGLADAFSRRMQVLIDGRSVYIPGFGQVPWAELPLSIEDVERIEVVRGPNAAAYGANAFFGVINIITKEPSQVPGVHVSAQAGDKGMRGALLRYGGGSDDFRFRLTLSEQRRDRFENQAEKTTTKTLDFRGDYRLSNTDELTVNVVASQGDWRQGRENDPFEPVRDDVNVGSEQVQAKFKRVIDPRTEWSLQFYHIRNYVRDDFIVRNYPIDLIPGPPPELSVDIPIDFGQTHWREDVEFQMISSLAASVRLVGGAEARWEGVEAPGFFYGKNGRSGALYRLFGNIEWMPTENWVLNGGMMAEHHYYSGLDLSPRLAVNYLASPDHAFRGSIGYAHRSPTFFEEEGDIRYFTTTNILLGRAFAPNGNLQPESILSREIGYVGHVRPLGLRVDARLFNDRVRKLVGQNDIDPGSNKTFQAANKHFADIRGADIQLRWQPHRDFDLILNYARANIDSDNDDARQSAPANNFSALGIYRLPGGWEASAAAYKVGLMKWLGDGDVTKGYTRVDARLARRFTWQGRRAELALVAQSIDSSYSEFRQENVFGPKVYGSFSLNW